MTFRPRKPSIGSERVVIVAILKKSSSLEETKKELEPIHKYLNTLSEHDIKSNFTKIGSIYRNHRHYQGVRYASIYLQVPIEAKYPRKIKERIAKEVADKLAEFKTKAFEELYTRTVMKGDEKNTKDIVTIFISGGDKISFESLQKEIQSLIKNVKDVKSVFIDNERMEESWQFLVNEKALISYQLYPHEVASQIREMIAPQELNQFRFNGENTYVYTQIGHDKKPTYEQLQKFKIITHNDAIVPISYLGHWKKTTVLKKISHEGLQRKFEIDVRYDKEKIDKEKIAKNIKESLKPLITKYPAYNFSVNKANEQEEKNKAWMLKIAFVCIGSILFVLAICLGSIVQPILVAFAIPFGIIGIVWALYFHGMEMGVMAIIGLIGMAGVVVNDSLIMVNFINKLKDLKSRREQIVEGATQRLRPIIITTVTTLGGVFPMAYGIGGESGFIQPLAFAMGWGLTFATLLTLFVLPALLEVTNDCENLLKRILLKLKTLIPRKMA